MSKEQSHKIGAQKFQIGIHDEQEATRVQAAISSLQQDRIRSLIDAVMSKHDSSQLPHKFDTVVLDLGSVSKANYENEIVFRIEEELNRFLQDRLRTESATGVHGSAEEVENRIELLEHFLLRGYLPWNAGTTTVPGKLLDELMDADAQRVIGLLSIQAKKQTVRKRLIWQFKDDQLDRVVLEASEKEGKQIVDHRKQLSAYHRKNAIPPVGESNFRDALWEIIMSYLFAESKSYSGKKEFLRFLIERVAKKYSLTYTSLLQQLTSKAQDGQLNRGKGDFERILLELGREDRTNVVGVLAAPTNKPHVISNVQFFKHIDYYIRNGRFPLDVAFTDKKQFLVRLMNWLEHTSVNDARSHVDFWLSTAVYRNRLLEITDDFTLSYIVSLSTLPWIKLQSEFIRAITRSELSGSEETRSIQKQIMRRNALLMVASEEFDSSSEKSIVYALLRSFLKNFEQSEDILFRLLHEVSAKLRSGFRNPLTVFLVRFYHTKGEQLLDHSAEEMLQTIESLPGTMWPERINNIVDNWMRKTGVSRSLAFTHLANHLKRNGAPERLLLLLNIMQEAGSSRQKFNQANDIPVLAEIVENLASSKTEPEQWSLFHFTLRTGRLPWWSSSYSWELFHASFATFWGNAKYRTKILTLVRGTAKNQVSYDVLSKKATHEVWKTEDVSGGKVVSNLLIHLDSWISERLHPASFIGAKEVKLFRDWVFQRLIANKATVNESEVITFLVEWIKNAGIAGDIAVRNKMQNLLDAVNVSKIEVERFFKNISAEGDDVIFLTNNPDRSYKGLLLQLYDGDPSTYLSSSEDLKPLLSWAKNNSTEFKALLSRSEFRNDLLAHLKPKQQASILYATLEKPQRQYYKDSVSFLGSLKLYLSEAEMDKIWRRFTSLVLLRFASRGFTSWHAKEWSQLVYGVMVDILGKGRVTTVMDSLTEDETSTTFAQDDTTSFKGKLRQGILKLLHRQEEPIENEVEASYRKLGEQELYEFMDPMFVNHAGLIILGPYLGMLFTRCEWISNGAFKDLESTWKALIALHYAATGHTDAPEHELVIPKLLCGLPVNLPVPNTIELTSQEKETVASLLVAVTQQWPGLGNTSINVLRETFLQRDGKLEDAGDNWQLFVEQKSLDVLMDRIPWNINLIKLSWMPKMLNVTWR